MNIKVLPRLDLSRCNLLLIVCHGCFCCFAWGAMADDAPQATGTIGQAVARVERGITGNYVFSYTGPALRVRTQRDADAPLMVRLRRLESPGEYEASFIGTREGLFDLCETLEHADGSAAERLPGMLVAIVSTLPDDRRSDLFEAVGFEPNLMGGYRSAIATAVFLWLIAPVTVMAIRYWRRPPQVEPLPATPAPTWGEQLEPLVAAAASRSLSAEEQGRLELLLLHYWREQSEMEGDGMADSIRKLRSHPEAGPILRGVEQWLHRSRAGVNHLDQHWPAELQQLFEPLCRQIAAASAVSSVSQRASPREIPTAEITAGEAT